MRDEAWERLTMMRVAAGDPSALSELYAQFAAQVFGLARRITHNEALAEEVTQEVFCQIWEHPERYKPERGAIRAFLCTLAHRRAVDCVRTTEARRRRDTVHHFEIEQIGRPDIVEEIASREIAGEVRAAVESLPEKERLPVTMAYFGGYTFSQVAAELNIPEGTAKTRIRRALARLGRALNERGVTA